MSGAPPMWRSPRPGRPGTAGERQEEPGERRGAPGSAGPRRAAPGDAGARRGARESAGGAPGSARAASGERPGNAWERWGAPGINSTTDDGGAGGAGGEAGWGAGSAWARFDARPATRMVTPPAAQSGAPPTHQAHSLHPYRSSCAGATPKVGARRDCSMSASRLRRVLGHRVTISDVVIC